MLRKPTQNITEGSSEQVLRVIILVVAELFFFNLQHPVVDEASDFLEALAAGDHQADSHCVDHREKQRRKLRQRSILEPFDEVEQISLVSELF